MVCNRVIVIRWRGGMRLSILAILVFSLLLGPGVAGAQDASELAQIKREIRKIKVDEERERERDEQLIGKLEQKVERLENQNRQLQQSSEKLQTQTTQQYQNLEQ